MKASVLGHSLDELFALDGPRVLCSKCEGRDIARTRYLVLLPIDATELNLMSAGAALTSKLAMLGPSLAPALPAPSRRRSTRRGAE